MSRASALQVKRRIRDGRYTQQWAGHVWSGDEALVQDSRHRPQDLRVAAAPTFAAAPSFAPTAAPAVDAPDAEFPGE